MADGPKLLGNLKDQNEDAVDLDYLVDNFKSVQTTTAPPPSQNADAVDLDCLVDNFKTVPPLSICIVFSELFSPGFWFQSNITVLDSLIPAAFRFN